jgi:putative ABC transport system ATP-binding protein
MMNWRYQNRKIGFIFQAFNLLPRTSALKNVMLPMMYAGIPKDERIDRAKKYLKRWVLATAWNIRQTSFPRTAAKVAIARGLAMNPAILLADEPTGNIASAQAEEVMAIFQDLNEKGHTIIMITHEPDIAHHAKRIIHIRDGKLQKDAKNGSAKRIGYKQS